MKTVIAFPTLIAAMLVKNGNDLEQVVNACQSDANQFTGTEGQGTRSAFKGGHSYNANGELKVKPLSFKETTPIEYSGTTTAPGELVKWSDSLVSHWKKTGAPVGELPASMLPLYVHDWLSRKCRADAKPEAKPEAKRKVNGEPAVA